MIFSIDRDGTSLDTFYAYVDEYYDSFFGAEETIMLIEDQNGAIFGSYTAERWRHSQSFYGDPTTFIFKIITGKGGTSSKAGG